MDVLNTAYAEQVSHIYKDTTVISVIVLEYCRNVFFRLRRKAGVFTSGQISSLLEQPPAISSLCV